MDEFKKLKESEKHALVYLYHLSDRIYSDYGAWSPVPFRAINKMECQIIDLKGHVSSQKYSQEDLTILRDIQSSIKELDGNHYLIFLCFQIIDLLDKGMK